MVAVCVRVDQVASDIQHETVCIKEDLVARLRDLNIVIQHSQRESYRVGNLAGSINASEVEETRVLLHSLTHKLN